MTASCDWNLYLKYTVRVRHEYYILQSMEAMERDGGDLLKYISVTVIGK